MMTVFVECVRLDLENHLKCPKIQKPTSSKRKFRKYDTVVDASCAFETNDLNLTTANFDSYGNDCSKKTCMLFATHEHV